MDWSPYPCVYARATAQPERICLSALALLDEMPNPDGYHGFLLEAESFHSAPYDVVITTMDGAIWKGPRWRISYASHSAAVAAIGFARACFEMRDCLIGGHRLAPLTPRRGAESSYDAARGVSRSNIWIEADSIIYPVGPDADKVAEETAEALFCASLLYDGVIENRESIRELLELPMDHKKSLWLSEYTATKNPAAGLRIIGLPLNDSIGGASRAGQKISMDHIIATRRGDKLLSLKSKAIDIAVNNPSWRHEFLDGVKTFFGPAKVVRELSEMRLGARNLYAEYDFTRNAAFAEWQPHFMAGPGERR